MVVAVVEAAVVVEDVVDVEVVVVAEVNYDVTVEFIYFNIVHGFIVNFESWKN